ncbi:MAG: glycoside hydrolase family 32 protein, partial [Clostridia bacterium]|nr:glycoside hydrolase family 32 protein [Clostridia bacterium]
MLFLENGKLIFDLRVLLDNKKPDGYYYYDVTRFAGRDISFIVNGAEYDPEIVDFCLEGTGDEPLRPRMHFTAKRGWINDPNGLVYSSGVYHMFYQHNPVGYLWDNMHWGHAISKDLINWERLEYALYPDEMGTMYSGSGIVDERNVTGLAVGDAKTICLFYTAFGNAADGGNAELSKNKNSCQCLAYSVDGGKTFTKYERNPLISGYSKEARDPKVIWVEELGAYVLALYLERHDFMLFSSTDLLTWEEYQRISIPSDSECPDFYPLTADDGKRKWVFSGASDYYLIGDLTQSGFISTQGEKRMCRGN